MTGAARRFFVAGVFLAACAGSQPRTPLHEPLGTPILTPQRSGTVAQIIGLDAADERIAWAAGAGGTWVRTTDGGATWETGVVAGAESLQFRDVHAVDD
ncbi:MAG: hypothetical protein ACREK2_00665, partial [Gemmatimonadota bacterium]